VVQLPVLYRPSQKFLTVVERSNCSTSSLLSRSRTTVSAASYPPSVPFSSHLPTSHISANTAGASQIVLLNSRLRPRVQPKSGAFLTNPWNNIPAVPTKATPITSATTAPPCRPMMTIQLRELRQGDGSASAAPDRPFKRCYAPCPFPSMKVAQLEANHHPVPFQYAPRREPRFSCRRQPSRP